MHIGSRLKAALKEREMTVSQLSRQSGVPAQTIYAMIKRDSNRVDLDILVQLLEALSMGAGDFLGIPEPDKDGGKIEERIQKDIFREEGIREEFDLIPADLEFWQRWKDLALSYEITEPDSLREILEEYLEEGFLASPASLEELLRRRRPKRAARREMDDYLL